MKHDRYTKIDIKNGKAALENALRILKAEGLTGQPPFGTQTNDLWRYYGTHNFHAFVVAKRSGGWVADLVFKNLPKDFPDVIGTPDRSPCATYEDAFLAGLLQIGKHLLQLQAPYLQDC